MIKWCFFYCGKLFYFDRVNMLYDGLFFTYSIFLRAFFRSSRLFSRISSAFFSILLGFFVCFQMCTLF
eukprot:UN02850